MNMASKSPAHHADAADQANRMTGYHLIFMSSFVMFLAVALLSKLIASPWRSWLPGAESDQSLMRDVKAAVYTFMSYLT